MKLSKKYINKIKNISIEEVAKAYVEDFVKYGDEEKFIDKDISGCPIEYIPGFSVIFSIKDKESVLYEIYLYSDIFEDIRNGKIRIKEEGKLGQIKRINN